MEQEASDVKYRRKSWFDIMERKYYDSEFMDSSSEEGWNSDFSLPYRSLYFAFSI